MIIPGTDGQKMSKSYNNYISILGDKKILKKQIMNIVTDSKSLDESKNANQCNVFQIYKLIAPKSKSDELKFKYDKGGLGYGHAKAELFEMILEKFQEPRERFEELMKNPKTIENELAKGASRAQSIASGVLKRIKINLGLMSA